VIREVSCQSGQGKSYKKKVNKKSGVARCNRPLTFCGRARYDKVNSQGGVAMEEKKVAAILDMAIEREEEAFTFYQDLFKKVEDKTAKETLQFLSNEEKKHKEFLENYRKGGSGTEGLRMTDVVDYKIAEHLTKPDIQKNMETKDIYLVAAHRELNSYNFYKSLADMHPDGKAKSIFLRMANEEKKHKEKVEYLYSNTAFPQTSGG
jgi:rubrerythrin